LVIPPEAPGIVVSGAPQAAPAPSAKEMAAEAAKAEKAAAKADSTKAEAAKIEAAKADVAKAEAAAAQEAAKKKSSTSGRVVIRAVQSSWVMVTDADGKAIFDGVLKPGETFNVPDRPGLNLTTGNGNGIVLSLNGNELPKIASGAPRVVRNISLDPDRLAAGSAQ
jgi:cytoskeleton protein RodZ